MRKRERIGGKEEKRRTEGTEDRWEGLGEEDGKKRTDQKRRV